MFITILSYLKSCGDEYQRLTCECMNYIINSQDNNVILNYIESWISDINVNENIITNEDENRLELSNDGEI